YHAKGDAGKAIEYYRKVKEQFSDASEALGWFERRFVALPEVTIFHPDAQGYRESEEWSRYLKSRKLAAASDSAVRGPGSPTGDSPLPRRERSEEGGGKTSSVVLTSNVQPIGAPG